MANFLFDYNYWQWITSIIFTFSEGTIGVFLALFTGHNCPWCDVFLKVYITVTATYISCIQSYAKCIISPVLDGIECLDGSLGFLFRWEYMDQRKTVAVLQVDNSCWSLYSGVYIISRSQLSCWVSVMLYWRDEWTRMFITHEEFTCVCVVIIASLSKYRKKWD